MDDSLFWTAIGGVLALALAVAAWFADRWRHNRKHMDRVGFMPWTAIFFWCLLLALLLLGFAARQWRGG